MVVQHVWKEKFGGGIDAKGRVSDDQDAAGVSIVIETTWLSRRFGGEE